MQPGIKGHKERVVTDELTAKRFGSGTLEVFGTPAMIALLEETCLTSIEPYLEEGQGSVGTKIDVEHLAATPLGMKVRCESELIEVDRRRLVFSVEIFDEAGLVGRGRHERFIIQSEKFMAKAMAKAAPAE